jgi:hypothetical protein
MTSAETDKIIIEQYLKIFLLLSNSGKSTKKIQKRLAVLINRLTNKG